MSRNREEARASNDERNKKKTSFRICLWAKLTEWKYEKRTFYFAFKTRASVYVYVIIMFLPIYLRAGSSQELMMQPVVVVGMEIRLERFAMYDHLRSDYISPRSMASCCLLCKFVYEMVIKFNPWTVRLRVCTMKSKEVFQESSPHTPFPTIFTHLAIAICYDANKRNNK